MTIFVLPEHRDACTTIAQVIPGHISMSAFGIAIIFIFALGASFIQRVTGFGFGIFIMTILPHVMPGYGEATALSGMLALANVTVTAVRLRSEIDWKKLLPILLTFLAVSFVAVQFVAKVDGKSLKHVLGGVLIVISIYFFLCNGKVRMRPSIGVQAGMGTLSGIMGGLFAMQGPPAVIYFLSCTDTKEQYTALISAYFFISNLMMTLFRARIGFVTERVWICFAAALPAVALGLLAGRKVYGRIPIATLRRIVYAFMAVSGAVAILA